MATSVDLVFSGPPLTAQPIALVFNDTESTAPPAGNTITAAGAFPNLGGFAVIGSPMRINAVGSFAVLQGDARVVYNSDTQRPMVGAVVDRFQDARPLDVGLAARMQDAKPVRAPNAVRFQDALALRAGLVGVWQRATRAAVPLAGKYAVGLKVDQSVRDGFKNAAAVRVAAAVRYQDGLKVGEALAGRFQSTLKQRAVVADHFQEASRYLAGALLARAQRGLPFKAPIDVRYQRAIRPPPGLWFRPPVVPLEPCYVPSTDLVFVAPWSADTGLVFICERHSANPDPDPEPELPGQVVVPVLRIYTVLNSALLRRVDTDVLIPATNVTLALDSQSWTWGFSARIAGFSVADLQRQPGAGPVEVEAQINGVAYRFLLDNPTRNRAFGRSDIAVTGRGKASLLDAPHSAARVFNNAAGARTAQQLANDVLSINGVPIGWDIDAGWKPEDWLVPAGVWSHQGTYITALSAIAEAAGGYLQPHRTANALSVLLRYPVAPWEWSGVAPDIELPAELVNQEGISWTDAPVYNRVFVSGTTGSGVLANVLRAGTAGDVEAPMVVDPLMTTVGAARQRALPILANGGRQAIVTLRLPVLPSIGIIPPGKFIRYVDRGITRIGLSRSVNATADRADQKLTVWQTLGVETHVDF